VTINSRQPAMKSRIENKIIKHNNRMSVIDIQEIKLLYNCLNTPVEEKNKFKKSLTFNIK
jgi:hypothetical protein